MILFSLRTNILFRIQKQDSIKIGFKIINKAKAKNTIARILQRQKFVPIKFNRILNVTFSDLKLHKKALPN